MHACSALLYIMHPVDQKSHVSTKCPSTCSVALGPEVGYSNPTDTRKKAIKFCIYR